MLEFLLNHSDAIGNIGVGLILLGIGLACTIGTIALGVWGIYCVVCWVTKHRGRSSYYDGR